MTHTWEQLAEELPALKQSFDAAYEKGFELGRVSGERKSCALCRRHSLREGRWQGFILVNTAYVGYFLIRQLVLWLS